jgi:maltose phosphorylase
MYLRTARLDLDDYNSDTDDGLHITSMGGTWMAFVMGFGGVRVKNGRLIFHPFLPKKWKSWSFRIDFRGAHLEVTMKKDLFTIVNHSEKPAQVEVWNKSVTVEGNSNKEFEQ